MAVGAILAGIGMGANALGAEANRATTLEGVKTSADIQQMGLDFAQKLFDQSMARERPFIEAGQAALPLAQLAAQGQGKYQETPLYQFRNESGAGSLANLVQGGEISPFAQSRFTNGLNVSEEAQNRARLNDLLSIGLGSSGTAGQQSNAMANTATNAAIAGGQLGAAGTQTAFEQRQNTINGLLQGLGGLSSYVAANRSPTSTRSPMSQTSSWYEQNGPVGGRIGPK